MNYKPTIPDYLSLFRIIVAFLLIFILLMEKRMWFGIFMVAGFISDFLDGYIARNHHQVTSHGASLDSAADAVLAMVAMFGIIYFETSFVLENKFFILPVIFLYFFQLFFAYLKYGKSTSFHTYGAKLTACVQGVFFTITIFFEPIVWLFYLTLLFSVLETLEEIILIKKINTPKNDVKGLYWIWKKENK